MEHSKSSDKSEYRVGLHSVRLQTAPTGRESVYLFFEFTIETLLNFFVRIILDRRDAVIYNVKHKGARVGLPY